MSAPPGPAAQGLVARDQLPLPAPYIGPRTDTERRLAEIWRAVLGMDCVGVNDSYHDLGGDSFHAAMIFAQIGAQFQIDLPLATLARAATVAELAAVIDRTVAASDGAPAVR